MVWLQGAICLVFWCGAAFFAMRRAWESPQPKNGLAGLVPMVGGAVVMFLGMAGVASAGGMVDGRLTPLAWIAAALLGAIFISGQAWGSVWILRGALRRETGDNGEASKKQENEQ